QRRSIIRVIPVWRPATVERRVDTMMLPLTLAAGLLAAPEPPAEQQKGWVVEIRGYTYHPEAMPKDRSIIDFQWPQAEPQPEPFKVQVEAVEAFYVDDLRAYIEQLKKR